MAVKAAGEGSQVAVEIQDLAMERAMVGIELIRTAAAILPTWVIGMVCHLPLPKRIVDQHGDGMIDPTLDYLQDHPQFPEIIFPMISAELMVGMSIDLGLGISSAIALFQEAGLVELISIPTFRLMALMAAEAQGMIVVDETRGMTVVMTETEIDWIMTIGAGVQGRAVVVEVPSESVTGRERESHWIGRGTETFTVDDIDKVFYRIEEGHTV
jgi:hypothetical protein